VLDGVGVCGYLAFEHKALKAEKAAASMVKKGSAVRVGAGGEQGLFSFVFEQWAQMRTYAHTAERSNALNSSGASIFSQAE
jgi:hypothetical protein